MPTATPFFTPQLLCGPLGSLRPMLSSSKTMCSLLWAPKAFFLCVCVFFFFKVGSTPNLGLDFTIPRSRVALSTDRASQVPLFTLLVELVLHFCFIAQLFQEGALSPFLDRKFLESRTCIGLTPAFARHPSQRLHPTAIHSFAAFLFLAPLWRHVLDTTTSV